MSLYRKINTDPRGLQEAVGFLAQIAISAKILNTSVLGSAMALTAVLLCTSDVLFAQADQTTTSISADKAVFDDTVAPFLSKYCADCHGEHSNDSGVVLSGVSFDLASGHDMELWKTVLRQLHVEEMPPTGSQQPEQYEKDAVLLWINSELSKSGNVSEHHALYCWQWGGFLNNRAIY